MKKSSYRLRHIYDDLTYPVLNMKVCLSGPPEDRRGFTLWLGRAGCRFVDDPLQADLVIFTGGADVSPEIYGDKPIKETYSDPKRDAEDTKLWDLCREHGIPMVGICRGSQFIWAKKGGFLFQDVDHHNDGVHNIYNFADRKIYKASSVHHQMCRPQAMPGFKLLANAAVSKNRKASNWESTGPSTDFEIYAFPDEGIIGIQGHPEYEGFPEYSALCARIIDQYIYENPKIKYVNGLARIQGIQIIQKETK